MIENQFNYNTKAIGGFKMKKWNCRVTSILMFAVLFLMMPPKSATAQKLISETLQSKTLVEEDDGFKWYRYVYEYQVKFKGNKINFTRESAYNTNGRVIIDGSFNVDWIKKDCDYAKFVKKDYKKYPSKIKEEYSLKLDYNSSYGLFVANNGNGLLGTFSKEGVCYTCGGKMEEEKNVIFGLSSYKVSDLYRGGMCRWIKGKEKYHKGGVVKEGKIVVPFRYDQIIFENGLYFGGRYSNQGERYAYYVNVYTSNGDFIGNVGEKYSYTELSKEFFDGPNGEKWLKYCNSSYTENNGFYYCINSGKKIDYGYNKHYTFGHDNIDKYLKIGGNLYTGDGEQITNYNTETSYTYLFNNGVADLFVVQKGDYKHKGLIKIEGNKAKEVIACEYGEISCLNKDGKGDLFLVERPYNGDIYNEGVMKVEGNIVKTILDCNYSGRGGNLRELGLYKFTKHTDEYYDVVIDEYGNIIAVH